MGMFKHGSKFTASDGASTELVCTDCGNATFTMRWVNLEGGSDQRPTIRERIQNAVSTGLLKVIDLANATGVAPSSASNWVHNKSLPSTDKLPALLKLLNNGTAPASHVALTMDTVVIGCSNCLTGEALSDAIKE